MVRFWNKDLKRITFFMIIIAFVGGALCNLALYQYTKQSRHREYATMESIIESVMCVYPEVPEEEIIKAIMKNDGTKQNIRQSTDILAKYGILDQNSSIFSGEDNRKTLTCKINGVILFTILCSAIVFFWFWKKRNERLSELCRYVDRISLGDDDMDIRNNQEDELSGLKNELYKLMIAIREQAGAEKAGKSALAEAVENISHQLKTPLTSVVVLADNILEDEEMPVEVRRRFMQEISRQLSGMKWLVVTLLKLSRLDAGVVELAKEKVSLKTVLGDAIQNLEMNAEWKEITFVTKLMEGEILGDEKWLLEGFQNVIKNAIEFSPHGGAVEITMEDNDVYAQVTVRDHGPGISEEARKHLFERFYSTSKMENENVGIGLALSKEIIEKHNGYVTVNSGSDGTEFVIKFLKHF